MNNESIISNAQVVNPIVHSENVKQGYSKIDFDNLVGALDEFMTVAITDLTGKFTYVNDNFIKISGYSYQELIGKNPRILKSNIHSDLFYRDMWKTLLDGKPHFCEICNRNKEGGLYWLHEIIKPIFDADNQLIQFISIDTDITSTKNTEIKLQEVEMYRQHVAQQERQNRLASLGTLAAGIAHDFNNQMGMLLGYVELLLATTSDIKTSKTLLAMMQVLNRSIGTVSKLTAVGSKAPNRSDWFCLATMLTEEHRLLMFTFDDIKLTLNPIIGYKEKSDSEQDQPDKTSIFYYVIGDESAFSQVLTNLCINASKHAFAGREDGHIQLSLDRVEGEDNLRLRIADNGCGIKPELLEKIYEPYFTTGSEADCSGLGLFMVQGIITRMGGTIECESEVGKGTTFTITLPVAISCSAKTII